MTFKDQIAKDNQYVFANKDEFWEYHIVNGKKMLCQVDNNELIDREKRYKYRRSPYADGVYLKELLIYVKAEDFGPLPGVGRAITFDKKSYIVSDAINECGIYSLCLEANKT